jgi:hypothetical protein
MNKLWGMYLFGNMLAAILAVPYFAAMLITGYDRYVSFDWVIYVVAVDLVGLFAFWNHIDAKGDLQ